MKNPQRSTPNGILHRAHRTTMRAAFTAEALDDQELADDIWLVAAELRRLVDSTADGPLPKPASPRRCA